MNHNKPLYIYIMARGHSGSTMLELLLNRNKHIVAAGEIDMLGLQIHRDHTTRWEGVCSCGERPHDCSVWGPIINKLENDYNINLKNNPFSWPISDIGMEEEYGWKKPFDMLRYRFHRMARTEIHRHSLTQNLIAKKYRSWAENRDILVTSIAAQRNALAVVDASKDPLQILDIHSYSKLPFKILFLTRDVRGNVWSALKNGRADTAQAEATRWAKQNQRMLENLQKLPTDSWTKVQYENLCANTDTELNRIFDFLGIQHNMLTAADELKKRHTIAGNKTRFKCLNTINEDNAWRENLTTSQLSIISQAANDVAHNLGYEI